MKNLLFKLYALTMALCVLAAWSCKSDEQTPPPDDPGKEVITRFVKGVVLDKEYEVEVGDQITLTGSGFAAGDYLLLRLGSDIRCTTASVDDTAFSFTVPESVVSGTTYSFVLRRGNNAQMLGSAVIKIKSPNTDVPDKEGMSIKGRVFCGEEAVAGALVSDGVQIVQTDEHGHYWIASAKRHGSVFIITPSGYEVATKEAMPQFWHKLTKGQNEMEQHDFELFKRDNDNHIMLVATDMHLANRSTKDLQQFTTGWVSEVTTAYNNSATPVYCLNLGDWAWDLYWYQNNYSLADAKGSVKDLQFQFWSTMGNHDNDAAYQGDWAPEQAFRDEIGPVFYSMNIGKVHYIMLDDTVYKNTGTPGHTTIAGDRSYDKYFTADNINFVKEDLKYVDPSTPIFVGYHCPIKSMAYNAANGWYASDAISQTYQKQLLECFAGYQNVTLLSGHSHVNRNVPIEGYATKMMEQNVAAVCGTWWWTYQYANNNVCCDGSPAGYKIFTVNGDQITYQYKGMGLDVNKQFQTYDMNEFMKWWNSDSKVASFKTKLPARANDYSDISSSSNTVYINVWAWDPSWTIEVKENVKALDVKQIRK